MPCATGWSRRASRRCAPTWRWWRRRWGTAPSCWGRSAWPSSRPTSPRWPGPRVTRQAATRRGGDRVGHGSRAVGAPGDRVVVGVGHLRPRCRRSRVRGRPRAARRRAAASGGGHRPCPRGAHRNTAGTASRAASGSPNRSRPSSLTTWGVIAERMLRRLADEVVGGVGVQVGAGRRRRPPPPDARPTTPGRRRRRGRSSPAARTSGPGSPATNCAGSRAHALRDGRGRRRRAPGRATRSGGGPPAGRRCRRPASARPPPRASSPTASSTATMSRTWASSPPRRGRSCCARARAGRRPPASARSPSARAVASQRPAGRGDAVDGQHHRRARRPPRRRAGTWRAARRATATSMRSLTARPGGPARAPRRRRRCRPGAAGGAGRGALSWFSHGRLSHSQATAPASSVAHRIQPSAWVGTPTYFRPEAKMTKAIAGRT